MDKMLIRLEPSFIESAEKLSKIGQNYHKQLKQIMKREI
jgi:hypothetical protein